VEFGPLQRARVDRQVTGLICNSFSIITLYNPPLWEYSGDNSGTRGHNRPCLGTFDTRVPINTPYSALERPD
jgi:hypothetical protein